MENELDQFDKPLNEWVEEDIPVKRYHYDKDANKVRVIDRIEKQRVKYIHAPKVSFRCKTGTHEFYVTDIHKWIFSCKKCPFAKRVFPTSYELTPERHLRNIKTGQLV